MKKFTFLFLIFISLGTTAQFEHMFIRTGYQWGTTKFDAFQYSLQSIDAVNGTSVISLFGEETYLRNRYIPIDLEVYGKSGMFNMGINLGPKKWNKPHKKTDYVQGSGGPGFYTRMAFGGYMGDGIGIMFGAQYSYNAFEMQGNENYAATNYNDIRSTGSQTAGNYNLTYSGGNQRGFGAHLMLNGNNSILIRASLLYDWIKRKGIPGNKDYGNYEWKGNALTIESGIYLMFDDDENFGISLNGSWSRRSMKFGYNEDGGYNNYPTAPDHTLKDLNFSVNLLIPADWLGSASSSTYTIRVVD
jgi:hypothetical protein